MGATRTLLLLATTAVAACRAAPRERTDEGAAAEPTYTLVFLKTGPRSESLSSAESQEAFAGHFANMGRLAEEGRLLVAGPFGEGRHDPALRGLFVLATSDREEAVAWAGTDPTTIAGVFVQEFHELATSAPLARALERDLERLAREEAAGRTPEPGENIRPYVLLTAEHGDLARRELGRLCNAEGGVFLLARLDGSRALALLDAQSPEEARERFAPELEHLGAHELDGWFASRELAHLVEP
jgi:uncharacterized protein YciI